MCIERQEIDETYGTTVTLFGGKPDEEEANEGESKEEETVDEQSTEVSSDRDGRQLKFTTKSHFRISSCSHQGLTYVCETKYAILSTKNQIITIKSVQKHLLKGFT